MLITLFHCPRSKHGPYHLVYDVAAWPPGTVRNRGWLTASIVYRRHATQCDNEISKGAWRFQCWRYRDIDSLRADEARCGIDYDLCIKKYNGEWLPVADVAIAESARVELLNPTN